MSELRSAIEGFCQDVAGLPDALVEEEFTELYLSVKRDSGASNEEIHHFFAEGMLLNVAAALELGGKPETWSLSGSLAAAKASGGAT